MYNVILPMSGNAERMDSLVDSVPKQLLPVFSTPYVTLRVIDYALRCMYNTYPTKMRIGAVIPSGSEKRMQWNKCFRETIKYLSPYYIDQDVPNGTFGAVKSYLNAFPDFVRVDGTFILLPDTIIDITPKSIQTLVKHQSIWCAVTPKRWYDGDVAVTCDYHIDHIAKEHEMIGMSPAGLFYFRDTALLLEVLNSIALSDIGVMDIINAYRMRGILVTCGLVPRIIDCGTPHTLAEARKIASENNGNIF